jgi:hypothetical protein
MTMKTGDAVVITWGAYIGLEGEVKKINGKNVYVMLSLGYEEFFSTDHIEVIKKVVMYKNVAASTIKSGDMVRRYNDACEAREVLKAERRGADSIKLTVKDGTRSHSYTIRLSTTVYKMEV